MRILSAVLVVISVVSTCVTVVCTRLILKRSRWFLCKKCKRVLGSNFDCDVCRRRRAYEELYQETPARTSKNGTV